MATFSTTNESVELLRWENGEIIDIRDLNNAPKAVLRKVGELIGALGFIPGAPGVAAAGPACRTVQGALKPSASGASVRVQSGVFLFTSASDIEQPEPGITAHSIASLVIVGSASDNLAGGADRQDLLTVKVNRNATNAADLQNRFGRISNGDIIALTPRKRFRTEAVLSYYEGTPGGGDPSIPADEVAIARFTMRDGESEFAGGDVEDLRTSTGWLPAALPGSTSLLQVTSGGVVEASRDPSVDTIATSGNATIGGAVLSPLRLKESGASTHRAIVAVPSGWDAAASSDATLSFPPQANVPASAEIAPGLLDEYTPIVLSGLTAITYTSQRGLYQRLGHLVVVQFEVAWSAATTSGSTFAISLPSGTPSSIRVLDTPLMSVIGAAYLQTGASSGLHHCLRTTGSAQLVFRNSTGNLLTGTLVTSSNTLYGSFAYFTSP